MVITRSNRQHKTIIVILLLALLLLPVTALFSQNAAQLEREAQELYVTGEGKMKTSDYLDAINIFRNVLKRYPDTETRYEAQFRISDAYVALRNETEAIATLNAIVKENSEKWSPKALLILGEVYASVQKYSESFRSYRLVITDYPNSPEVDMAHFSIGRIHFQLGHFELAADELQRVGLATATHSSEYNRVTPGQPLYVRINEPNMVAKDSTTIKVTVSTSSGDIEEVLLLPEAVGGSQFGITIFTEMGQIKPNDGKLQINGTDTIKLTYLSQYLGGNGVTKTMTASVASTAKIVIKDISGDEITGVLVPDSFMIEIDDPDQDLTNNADTITIQLTTRAGDSESITLIETGAHTGIFRGNTETMHSAPTPDSKKIETNSDKLEDSRTQYNDYITIIYMDPLTMVSEEGLDTRITLRANLFESTDGDFIAPGFTQTDSSMTIKTALYKGKSLLQIAITYDDLGQGQLASINYLDAIKEFNDIISNYPNAPEVEDAMYGLFDVLIAQEQYDAAINQLARVTQRFPQSNRAGEAMLSLAGLHVKREEFDRALSIYQTIVQRTPGTQLAEEAQFAICETYIAMYRPKRNPLVQTHITAPQVYAALEEFIRSFPNSERTPDALFRLTQMRFENGDYTGAANSARRMYSLYPDHIYTGQALLLQAQAHRRLAEYDAALEILRIIIANYGSETARAETEHKEVSRLKGI